VVRSAYALESAVSIGPSHSVGRGSATAGFSAATTSSSTRSVSPTHRCFAPSTATSSTCGTTENRSFASGGRR
jgi:hypothetical protein